MSNSYMNKNNTQNMQKANVINRVKIALGLLKFEEAVLVDGTKVSAESFEPGMALSVVAEDGTVSAAPEGVHETADLKITVDANGVITNVEPKVAEVAAEETAPVVDEVEMAEETEETMEEGEDKVEIELPIAPGVIDAIIEALAPEMEMLKERCAKLEAKLEEMMPKVEEVKEDMSKFKKAPGASKITTSPNTLYNFGKENVEDFGSKVNRLKAMTKGMNVKF